jgi:hypothetical protein
MKKFLLISTIALATGCTQMQKDVAKTVLDVARNACDLYATQHGLSVKDVCDTEEKLRPFVDGYLASAQAAGAARTASMSGAGATTCPECPKCAEPAPAPAETPSPAPAPAAPAEAPAEAAPASK